MLSFPRIDLSRAEPCHSRRYLGVTSALVFFMFPSWARLQYMYYQNGGLYPSGVTVVPSSVDCYRHTQYNRSQTHPRTASQANVTLEPLVDEEVVELLHWRPPSFVCRPWDIESMCSKAFKVVVHCLHHVSFLSRTFKPFAWSIPPSYPLSNCDDQFSNSGQKIYCAPS